MRQASREPASTRALLRRAWAAPCSAVGLLLGTVLLAGGGRWQADRGVLLFYWRESGLRCGRAARALPYRAMALGHVVLAVTREECRALLPHERVHVAQYERWGPLFFPAYAASSLWQWLRGRDPYWDNHFEIEARALAGKP